MRSNSFGILLLAFICTTHCKAREWTDTSRNQSIEGDLVEARVILRLPSGRKKSVDLKSLSEADRTFIIQELQNQPPNPPKVAQVGKPARPLVKRGNAAQKYTEYGTVKLTEDEIKRFIANCKKQKPHCLSQIRYRLEEKADKLTPEEIVQYKTLLDLLSQDNVLIADTGGNGYDNVCLKIRDGMFADQGTFTNIEPIDKTSAYVTIQGRDNHVILEGIDTKKLPTGTWNSRLLLKEAGTKKEPGVFGDKQVTVYQAVSDEGFPKDIIIW